VRLFFATCSALTPFSIPCVFYHIPGDLESWVTACPHDRTQYLVGTKTGPYDML
jgi:hypothetical protein